MTIEALPRPEEFQLRPSAGLDEVLETFDLDAHFKLSWPQFQFIVSTAPYCALSAGYGHGKSHAELIATLKMGLDNKGLEIGLGSMDFPRLERDVITPLRDLLEKSDVDYNYKLRPFRHIELGGNFNGATLHLMSLLDPKQVKGANLAGFIGDEAAMWRPDMPGFPGTTWDVIRSRVRARQGTGQIKLGSTPEGWNNWFADEFVHGPDDIIARSEWELDHHLIYGSTYDNEENLQPGYIARLRRGLTKSQVTEKIFGRPAAISGKIAYYGYDRTRHCRPTSYHWSRGPLCFGLDWNVAPMACVVGQHHQGKFFVFGEIILEDNADTHLMARCMTAWCEKLGVDPRDAIAHPDVSGGHRDTRSGTTDIKILKAAHFRVRCGKINPNERGRVEACNAVLEHGNLQVDGAKCPVFTRDLQKVEKTKDGALDKKSHPELTHVSDGWGYWVCQENPVVGKGGMVTSHWG